MMRRDQERKCDESVSLSLFLAGWKRRKEVAEERCMTEVDCGDRAKDVVHIHTHSTQTT